ncbi:hypothetical protein KEJ18_02580 [Candidatus Bathyarchaeota archaeon]|nr:hypothetical protein [Candidatus Bathyarchaeota archaeon]
MNILRRWGEKIAEKARQAGADHVGGAHELWFSSPYTVPDEIRLNPMHPINCAIADMIAAIHKQGLGFGYWVRPEFVKQAYPMVMSSSFYTTYYGYVNQLFLRAIPIIEQVGLVLIRKHPEWIRRGRSGKIPKKTPYNWTPMSLTIKGWYEEVVYKTLVMMKKLGVDSVFQDGGFSNMPGVDYTSGSARAVQPYNWRFYQDVNCLGLQQNGENMTGWVTNNLHNLVENDTKHLWAFAFGNYRGNLEGDAVRFFTSILRHISHQLYIGAYLNLSGDPRHAEVARFAQKFIEQNGHPKRVYLEGLKWDESEQMWKWDNVWWEYGAGKRVRYPNYHEVIR